MDFSLLLLVKLMLLFLLYYCNSWKSNNYIGSNKEGKPWTTIQNRYKKLSDNFCYCKVRRAIKSNIAFTILEKHFGTKIISHFWSTNNNFAHCMNGFAPNLLMRESWSLDKVRNSEYIIGASKVVNLFLCWKIVNFALF